MGSESEGCVADDTTGALYVSEEDVGLWRYGAEPGAGSARTSLDTVQPTGHLAADVEGVTLVDLGGTEGYVIASAQNVAAAQQNYYVVYDRETNAYIESVKVVSGASADGCQRTDGITAYAGDLGPSFPQGAFVCQDNSNTTPGGSGNQSFKLVRLEKVVDLGGPVEPGITFVGASSVHRNNARQTVQIPAGVRPGDALTLFFTGNRSAVTVSGPAGWTSREAVVGDGIVGRLWTRTAVAGDAGSTVVVTLSATTKGALTVAAHRGTSSDPVEVSGAGLETTSSDRAHHPGRDGRRGRRSAAELLGGQVGCHHRVQRPGRPRPPQRRDRRQHRPHHRGARRPRAGRCRVRRGCDGSRRQREPAGGHVHRRARSGRLRGTIAQLTTSLDSSENRSHAHPDRRLAACLGAGALLLVGCDDASGSDAGGTAVVASAYPFAYVAERVGGDDVTVQNLTDPGVEPHDIELTPQQVADVGEADLLVYESDFQAAVDDAIELAGQDDDALLDVAEVVPPEDTGATTEGDESDLDPHVWLDPRHMVTITEAVADRLAAADPDHASAYRQRADALVDDLTALDRDFEQGLADCARTTVVTSHDAFRYLAMRYGLEMVPIAGIDPAQEPSPSEQAAIADTVADEGVTTIFTEDLVDASVADSIAAETGAQTATLSPIEGLSDDTSDEDYLSLMRANLSALEKANGCS